MMNFKVENYKISAMFILINSYFWKTKVGPIFSLVTPFIFMVIYYVLDISGDDSKLSIFVNALPAFLAMSIIPLSIVTLPSMNIEFKNSIILRKIKTSGINPLIYNVITFCFFLAMSLLFSLFTLMVYFIFLASQNSLETHINIGTLLYGILALSIVSITFGMFVSVFVKNPLSSQLSGFGIFVLTLTLSGQFIPVEVISKVDAIKYISLFSPLNYAANILNIACIAPVDGYNNSLFDLSSEFLIYGFPSNPTTSTFVENTPTIPEIPKPIIVLYEVWQKALFIFMPWILSGVFGSLAIVFFKSSGR